MPSSVCGVIQPRRQLRCCRAAACEPGLLVGARRGRVLGIAVGLMDAVRIAQAEWREFGRWG